MQHAIPLFSTKLILWVIWSCREMSKKMFGSYNELIDNVIKILCL